MPDYLLRKRVETPELNEFGMTLGGEVQAWLYRDDMHEVWMATYGMRRWLAQSAGS